MLKTLNCFLCSFLLARSVKSFTAPSLLQQSNTRWQLSLSHLDDHNEEPRNPQNQQQQQQEQQEPQYKIRFLGKGPNAIIRPGTVLVAPKSEFHHFYRRAAIFIYAMGEDEDMEDGTYVIRGAILDHPTPFTLGEMINDSALLSSQQELSNTINSNNNNNKNQPANPIASNLIYRGGDKGGDSVFMLHNQESIGNGEMIGTSGIFQGGLRQAVELCATGQAKAQDFKFFFNFCQFTEAELESMLDDDPWVAVEVPSEMVLSAEWDRGDCWKQLRNLLRDEITEDDQ